MATTARLDLSVWRNDDTCEIPVRVRGIDLAAVAMAMEVRLAPDTPGAPYIRLDKVTNGNAEGLRVAGVEQVDGVPESDLRIRINKATRQALPYAGEVGDAATLAYALVIAGVTRLVGKFVVLASTYASDNAPADRPGGGGASGGDSPATGAVLEIDRDRATVLTIGGLDLIAPLAAQIAAAADTASGQADRAVAAAAENPSLRELGPDLLPGAARDNAMGGGAQPINDFYGSAGFRIPAGATGAGSTIYFQATALDGARLAGSKIRLYLYGQTTGAFDRPTIEYLFTKRAGTTAQRPATLIEKTVTGGVYRFVIDYTIDAADTAFDLAIQTGAAAAASGEQTLRIGGLFINFVSSTTGLPAAEMTAQSRVQVLPQRAVTVAESNGTFTSLAQAFAALTDASAARRYEVILLPHSGGYWDATELAVPRYVDVTGYGRAQVHIRGYQAPSTSLAAITANSTLRVENDTRLRNLRVTGQNNRYAVHADHPTMVGQRIVSSDCTYEHFGNQEAIDWQAANGGNPAGVWRSDCPWGIGLFPGTLIRFDDGCKLRGRRNSVLCHTLNPNDWPSVLNNRGGRFEFIDSFTEHVEESEAMIFQSFDSGHRHVLQIGGSRFQGKISHSVQAGTQAEWIAVGHAPAGTTFEGFPNAVTVYP